MKKMFFIIFCLLIFEKLTFSQEFQKSQALNPTEKSINDTVFTLVSNSHNITFDARGIDSMVISKHNGEYYLKGSASNGLCGEYELVGKVVSKQKGITLISFVGKVRVGPNIGNFSTNMETKMEVDIYFSPNSVKGIYRMDRLPYQITIEQNGTYDFRYAK